MNKELKNTREKLLLRRVDEVLHYLWDPLGVFDIPEARDEYYTNTLSVFNLLIQGAEKQEVENFLIKLQVESMGLFPDRELAAEISEVLQKWKDYIYE